MYLEHFLRTRDFLKEQGLNTHLVMGTPITESDLAIVDQEIGRPMPKELRQFFMEMGDAFAFFPDIQLAFRKRHNIDDHSEIPLEGWEYMHLADFKIINRYFRQDVEDAATKEINNPSRRLDPAMIQKEMERRKMWMPFYGYGHGGSYLCLDLGVTPHAVRVHNNDSWVHSPKTWKLVLAPSFVKFFERWGSYHFLAPKDESWISLGGKLHFEGIEAFDWSPEHFPRIGSS